jgi:hypothetical protein
VTRGIRHEECREIEMRMSGDDPGALRELARRCRMLARGASTSQVADSLGYMARDYDREAEAAEAEAHAPPSMPA